MSAPSHALSLVASARRLGRPVVYAAPRARSATHGPRAVLRALALIAACWAMIGACWARAEEPRRYVIGQHRFRVTLRPTAPDGKDALAATLYQRRPGEERWRPVGPCRLLKTAEGPNFVRSVQVERDGIYHFVSRTADPAGYDPAPAGHEAHQVEVVADTKAPLVTLAAPIPGELLRIGEEARIRWSSNDRNPGVAATRLDYSLDDGRTWLPIAAGLDPRGIYPWRVPETGGEPVRLRVTVRDTAGNESAATTREALRVVAPNVDPMSVLTGHRVTAASDGGTRRWLAGETAPKPMAEDDDAMDGETQPEDEAAPMGMGDGDDKDASAPDSGMTVEAEGPGDAAKKGGASDATMQVQDPGMKADGASKAGPGAPTPPQAPAVAKEAEAKTGAPSPAPAATPMATDATTSKKDGTKHAANNTSAQAARQGAKGCDQGQGACGEACAQGRGCFGAPSDPRPCSTHPQLNANSPCLPGQPDCASKARSACIAYVMAGNLVRQGRLKDALRYYRTAVDADPGFAAAWNDFSVAYRRLGAWSKADRCIVEAIALRPDDPLYLHNRGEIYQAYGLSILMDPTSGDESLSRGHELIHKAIRFYGEAIDLGHTQGRLAERAGTYFRLGEISYYANTDLAGARQYWLKVMELHAPTPDLDNVMIDRDTACADRTLNIYEKHTELKVELEVWQRWARACIEQLNAMERGVAPQGVMRGGVHGAVGQAMGTAGHTPQPVDRISHPVEPMGEPSPMMARPATARRDPTTGMELARPGPAWSRPGYGSAEGVDYGAATTPTYADADAAPRTTGKGFFQRLFGGETTDHSASAYGNRPPSRTACGEREALYLQYPRHR